MHVRFDVPQYTTIIQLHNILHTIGNPKLTYHNCSLYGDVDMKFQSELYHLKDIGMIVNLGFLVVSDNPTPGEVDELN